MPRKLRLVTTDNAAHSIVRDKGILQKCLKEYIKAIDLTARDRISLNYFTKDYVIERSLTKGVDPFNRLRYTVTYSVYEWVEDEEVNSICVK